MSKALFFMLLVSLCLCLCSSAWSQPLQITDNKDQSQMVTANAVPAISTASMVVTPSDKNPAVPPAPKEVVLDSTSWTSAWPWLFLGILALWLVLNRHPEKS